MLVCLKPRNMEGDHPEVTPTCLRPGRHVGLPAMASLSAPVSSFSTEACQLMATNCKLEGKCCMQACPVSNQKNITNQPPRFCDVVCGVVFRWQALMRDAQEEA